MTDFRYVYKGDFERMGLYMLEDQFAFLLKKRSV